MKHRIDFFIAGFAKCGSTSLHHSLSRHKDIYLPSVKDCHEIFTQSGDSFREWLDVTYWPAGVERLRGLTSILMAGAPRQEAIRAVSERFPDARFLFIARDPFVRIESAFRQVHATGSETGYACPFELGGALDQIEMLLAESRYFTVLQDYLQHFSRERIHMMLLEDLMENPRGALADGLSFLGLDPERMPTYAPPHLNRGSAKYFDSERLRALRNGVEHPEMSQALRALPAYIQDQFLPQLGLRIPIYELEVTWREEDEARVVGALEHEVLGFLELAGRTLERWPRFAQAARKYGEGSRME